MSMDLTGVTSAKARKRQDLNKDLQSHDFIIQDDGLLSSKNALNNVEIVYRKK